MRATFGATLLACLSVVMGVELFGVHHLMMQPYHADSQSNLTSLFERRHRRGVDCSTFPGQPEDMLECCKIPTKSTTSEETGMESSFGEQGFDVEQIICAVEEKCKSKDLMQDNGKLDYGKCRADVDKDMPDDKWKSTIDTSFEMCSPSVIDNMVEKGSHNCSSGCLELGLCLFRQFYLNCPAEYWSSDDQMCAESKTYVEDCPLGPRS